MRTNIDIDEELMAAAKNALGTETKKETVELALRKAIEQKRRMELLDIIGTVRWEGDLDEMRKDRELNW